MTQYSDTQRGTGGTFAFVREGYDHVVVHELKTSDIESAYVYGRNDETIGTINDLKVGMDGKITHAIIDVGGFLGIGAHSVMLPFDQLSVLRETAGSAVRVHLDTTKEKLQAMPVHTS